MATGEPHSSPVNANTTLIQLLVAAKSGIQANDYYFRQYTDWYFIPMLKIEESPDSSYYIIQDKAGDYFLAWIDEFGIKQVVPVVPRIDAPGSWDINYEKIPLSGFPSVHRQALVAAVLTLDVSSRLEIDYWHPIEYRKESTKRVRWISITEPGAWKGRLEIVNLCRTCQTEKLQSMLSNSPADLNFEISGVGSPLGVSISAGCVDTTRLLLERGADPSLYMNGDPIWMQAIIADNGDLTRMLGEHVNFQQEVLGGLSAVEYAIYSRKPNSLGVLIPLLDWHKDREVAIRASSTMIRCGYTIQQIANLLKHVDPDGIEASEILLQSAGSATDSLTVEVIALLKKYGADDSAKDCYGQSALIRAYRVGAKRSVTALLASGSSSDLADGLGLTYDDYREIFQGDD